MQPKSRRRGCQRTILPFPSWRVGPVAPGWLHSADMLRAKLHSETMLPSMAAKCSRGRQAAPAQLPGWHTASATAPMM